MAYVAAAAAPYALRPPAKRPRMTDMQHLLYSLFHLLRTGYHWLMLGEHVHWNGCTEFMLHTRRYKAKTAGCGRSESNRHSVTRTGF